MQAVMGRIKKIFLFVFMIVLVSCDNHEHIDFDSNNQIFFNTFVRMNVRASGEEEFKKIDIIHVEGYYLDTYYYYNIKYHFNDKDYDILYVLRFNSLNEFFPITNEDDCYEYFPDTYSKYLNAKGEGKVEKFDKEKIDYLISIAFDKEINNQNKMLFNKIVFQ